MKRSTDPEFYQHVPRPVVAWRSPTERLSGISAQSPAQFLYAESGTMKVTTNRDSWILPSYRAVWFPPDYSHQAGTLSALEMRTLDIRRDSCAKQAPKEPRVISVSPLLRELVRRLTMMPIEYDEKGHDGRIIVLLLDEINWSPAHAVVTPALRDTRLVTIEETLSSNPDDIGTLEVWAAG